MTLLFNVKIFRKTGKSRRVLAELPRLFQHDFGAAVVCLEFAMNLNDPVLQGTHIANISKVSRKYHDGERANPEVFAKIKKCHTPAPPLQTEHTASDTLRLSHVLTRRGKGNAIGSAGVGVGRP